MTTKKMLEPVPHPDLSEDNPLRTARFFRRTWPGLVHNDDGWFAEDPSADMGEVEPVKDAAVCAKMTLFMAHCSPFRFGQLTPKMVDAAVYMLAALSYESRGAVRARLSTIGDRPVRK